MRHNEEWIHLTTFGSLIEAEIAKTKLMSDHIPTYIIKDDEGGMNPRLQFTVGVRLFVAKSSLAAAKKSLGLN